MKITVGSKVFNTKKELKEYVQSVMYKVKKGEPLKGLHMKVVDAVFRRHPNYEQKVSGQDYTIAVRSSSGLNKQYREFYIIREDGTETDFSYTKAISGKESKISDIKRTLRQVILPQQYAAKVEFFEKNKDASGYVVCAATGLKVKYGESHIDHFPKKFETIVSDWFKLNNLLSEDFELEDGGDNAICMVVRDKELEKSFFDYHKEHAKYRVVLAKANLQASRGSRELF